MMSMNLRDISSPQYESVTGRRRKVPYSSYLASLAPSIRESAVQERTDALRTDDLTESKRRFDLSYALQKEQMEEAKKQAERSAQIQTAGLAVGGGYLLSQLAAPAAAGSAASGAAASAAASQAATASGVAGGYMAEGIPAAAPGVLATYGPAAAGVAAIEAGYQLARPYVPKVADEMPGGENEWNAGLTIATRAGQGAVIGSVVPVIGTAVGAAIGAGVGVVEEFGSDVVDFIGDAFDKIGDVVDDACVIVTCCCGRDSEEVNLVRRYRDEFMTGTELRGYYMIADRVVPQLAQDETLRNVVKINLVDHLVVYCRWLFGLSRSSITRKTERIAEDFQLLCRIAGKSQPRYVRSNGEIY